MLQVVTKMYFRDGVPLHTTTHRETLHTNCSFFAEHREPIGLPVGRLLGSTNFESRSTVMVEVVEHLEALNLDGTESMHVATGGTELVDDLAAVLSFALDAIFSRHHDQVQRLVPDEGVSRRRSAAGLFQKTFQPSRVVNDADVTGLRGFMTDLLALDRGSYVKAIRAIRQVVGATRRAVEDPTGAYTDMVAALESLGEDELTVAATWDQYPSAKREVLGDALVGVEEQAAERVRAAVMEGDRLGFRRRFVSSTHARVGPEFFRSEAVGVSLPVQGARLERALGLAYDIRSRKSHVLTDLPETVWLFTGNETHELVDGTGTILTLEGMWRLVQHVIRRFVADSPKRVDPDFQYRDHLPGLHKVRLSPELWVGQPGGFDKDTALVRFDGVVQTFLGALASKSQEIADLGAVLAKIEQLVPGLAPGPARTATVGIYKIWHAQTAPELHREDSTDFLDRFGDALVGPSMTAFATALLVDGLPNWTVEEYRSLADERSAERSRGRGGQPLPRQIDAVLQAETADLLEQSGRHHLALEHGRLAVEELPGSQRLIDWEARLVAGNHDPHLDLRAVLFGEEAVGNVGYPELGSG